MSRKSLPEFGSGVPLASGASEPAYRALKRPGREAISTERAVSVKEPDAPGRAEQRHRMPNHSLGLPHRRTS